MEQVESLYLGGNLAFLPPCEVVIYIIVLKSDVDWPWIACRITNCKQNINILMRGIVADSSAK